MDKYLSQRMWQKVSPFATGFLLHSALHGAFPCLVSYLAFYVSRLMYFTVWYSNLLDLSFLGQFLARIVFSAYA